MFDWESLTRDVQERPLLFPLFKLYSSVLDIRRYDSFPFYVNPGAKKVAGFEDTVIRFLDFLVDAHEIERNKADEHKNQYQRTNYVVRNFHRYSNDTMANLMFDTKLRKSDYDQMNSVCDMQTAKFYATSAVVNTLALSYATYFFRFRRLSLPQTLAVGSGFWYAFTLSNDTMYKLIVDKKVIDKARYLQQDAHIQPNGSFKPRGHNY